MRTLVVYDNHMMVDRMPESSLKKGDDAVLFPLTSSTQAADRLSVLSREIGFSLIVLETARLINASADSLRTKYLEFVANLGLDVKHKGKNLREWFAVDEIASMWWMSLVAEKNTFKSNAFNVLAQCDAIVEVIVHQDIRSVVLAVDNPKLAAVLSGYFSKKGIACRYWPTRANTSWRIRLREHQGRHIAKHLLHLMVFAGSYFRTVRKIRQALRSCPRRMDDSEQFMLMNAFPYFDLSLAKKGIFQNEQYTQLQAALEKKNAKILWAVFYVNNQTVSFKDTLAHAKKFIEKGQNIYFVEEGCSFGMQVRVLVQFLLQSIKFLTVESLVARRHHWKGYDFYLIFKDEWYRSFLGPEGYQALLSYAMFQDLFKKARALKGLYCCEMQSWEKALIFAKKKTKSRMPLLAYQHTTVSYMLLNYFTTPMEINSNGRYAMAQPDKLVCNGTVSYDYMKEAGWSLDRLAVAEAVRFDEFRKHRQPASQKKRNIVLLALSISVEESSSLLNVVLDAFRGQKDVEVWVKPHPFVQAERIFHASGLSLASCPLEIKHEPIEELLTVARIVIVGESSVSLQALLFGCEIVLVNVPEWINMSPLKGFSLPTIHTVNSSGKLRGKVNSILTAKFDPDSYSVEIDALVNKFFCLNVGSETPDKFLELLNV